MGRSADDSLYLVATGRKLVAQLHVEDVPALPTAAGSSRLLHLVAGISGGRDAIPIDQSLTRLSAVRHQELDLRPRCVAAIDDVALGVRRKAGEAEAYRDGSDG
jgi:hypothetical protein